MKLWRLTYVATLGIALSLAARVYGLTDVTRPGDLLAPTSNNSPANERVENAIDDMPTTKYLNFDLLNTGFTVVPSVGPTVVSGLTLTSANDAPERDPAFYELSGSSDGVNFTLISSGPVPPFPTRLSKISIPFNNSIPYLHYRLIFPTVVNAAAANSMQIAEVEMLGVEHCDGASLAVEISGHGSVLKNLDQSCYETNSLVTLSAVPDVGWAFVGWSGDASGTNNPLTIALNTNKFVTARFESVLQLMVTATSDAGAGSLRQAVQDNNALGGGHTIVFADSVRGTITLTSGQLSIRNDVKIVGPGANVLEVSGNNTSRVLLITNAAVEISGVSVARGFTSFDTDQAGGGILNYGTLFMNDCIVRDCGGSSGVGILSLGRLTLVGCSILNNAVDSYGPTSGGLGPGGIFGDPLQLTNCTISGNGGAFAVWAGWNGSSMIGTTIAANINSGFNGNALIGNSIIAGHGRDVVGTFSSAGHNLIGIVDSEATGFGAVGDQVGTRTNPINPQLRPLGDYGGPTPTMPPLPSSPAVDQGKNFGQGNDQRGLPRMADHPAIPNATLGDGTDIGAVEIGLAMVSLVTNTNDSGAGSLRNALQTASAFETTVTFAPQVTNTITLTSGPLLLDRSIDIAGPGAKTLQVSGNNASSVFQINGGSVSISGLTIGHGRALEGGGLWVGAGNLTLSACHVVSNIADYVGGGVAVQNDATVIIENTAITANQASYIGGGMLHRGRGLVTLRNCTISSNRVTEAPGIVPIPNGGGITLTEGQLDILSCTIVGNVSTLTGGGLHNYGGAPGILSLRNSMVAGNIGQFGPDVAGAFNSGGYNLIGKADDSTGFTHGLNADQVGSAATPLDPLIGPLGDYGGPTPTQALRFDSPAIDQGNGFALAADQRGSARILDDPAAANAAGGDGTDIGAYEVDPRFRIVEWRRQGNDIALCLTTVLGRHYRMEYTNQLAAEAWTPFTNEIPGNGQLLWTTNYAGANQPKRFYRAAILP